MIDRSKQEPVQHWLQNLEKLAINRGCEVMHWGTSEGLPLLGIVRPSVQMMSAPRVYLSAGIHGDEPAGPLAVEHLLQKNLLHPDVNWTICPLLNPGGRRAGTRESVCGIDLNRDYLARESPEAAAHCAWIDTLKCHDLYLSFHEDWEATGFYLYEINTSPQTPFAAKILKRVATRMAIEPLGCIDEHTVCQPGHIAHLPEPDDPAQWPEAIYHCKRYPHLSYTFETPSTLPINQRVAAHVIATQTAVKEFLKSWRADSRGK